MRRAAVRGRKRIPGGLGGSRLVISFSFFPYLLQMMFFISSLLLGVAVRLVNFGISLRGWLVV